MNKKGFFGTIALFVGVMLVLGGGQAFAQDTMRWGGKNERILTISKHASGSASWENYPKVRFVKMVGGGNPNIVEIWEVKSTNSGKQWKKGEKTSLSSNYGNASAIRIRTESQQYVEVEAWSYAGRSKHNRFFLILPSSDIIFDIYGEGGVMNFVGNARSGIAYDHDYANKEDLEDFMKYIASSVDYDKVKTAVEDLKKIFANMTDKNKCPLSTAISPALLKTMRIVNPASVMAVDCNCKGDIVQHLVVEATKAQGLVGGVMGGLPAWTAPAEFIAARKKLKAQAVLALSIGIYYGHFPSKSVFNSRFKNDCYVLFADASAPDTDAFWGMADTARDEIVQQAASKLLAKLASKGLKAVPIIGTAISVIGSGAISASEAWALGQKADAYYYKKL